MELCKTRFFGLSLIAFMAMTNLAHACETPQIKDFDGVDCLHEGYARVLERGKWNYVNKDGKKLSETDFDYAWDFHEEMAAVEIQNKWGFIDNTGEVSIPIKYDYVWDFHDGHALVILDGEPMHIDKFGNQVNHD